MCVLAGLTPLSVIPKFTSVESFHIVVAGGPAGKFTAFMPGFGIGVPPMPTAHLSRPVSEKVEEPIAATDCYDEGEPANVIVDPRGNSEPKEWRPAPRDGTLKKVIGLMDISKPKGDQVLNRIEERLKERYGDGVEFRRYRKDTFSRRASRELIDQMSRECNHVIGALAD